MLYLTVTAGHCTYVLVDSAISRIFSSVCYNNYNGWFQVKWTSPLTICIYAGLHTVYVQHVQCVLQGST